MVVLKTLEEIKKKVGVDEEDDEVSESDSGPMEPAVVNKFNLVSWQVRERYGLVKALYETIVCFLKLNEDDGPSDEPNHESEPEKSANQDTKPKKKDKKKKKVLWSRCPATEWPRRIFRFFGCF